MTKHEIFIFAFLPFLVFGDCADCEAYKAQVVNDCNALDFSLQTVANNVNSSLGYANTGYTISTDPNDKAIFTSIIATLNNTQGYIDSVSAFVSSIRSTARSLQCSTNTVGGSCDCAQYLQTLISLLTTCNQTIAGISSGLDAVNTALGIPDATLPTVLQSLVDIQDAIDTTCEYLIDEFLGRTSNGFPHTLSDFYNLFGSMANAITNSSGTIAKASISDLYVISNSSGPYNTANSLSYWLYPFDRSLNSSTIRSLALKNLFLYGFKSMGSLLASLNNYAYVDYLATGVATNLLSDGFSSVTNTLIEQFSIFNDAVFSADAPLSMYTDKQTDGSYHDYLTNYYIKVSKGQQSGSDSFTNWFSRVELLLASLVFRDEDDSTINTNGVPSESDKNSVTEVGSSLGQTISGFVQDGNSHVSSVDTSGKSIIRMVTSWNSAIGQTAKPAPFVVAEFTAPDSQSRSNISLWLDTEDERLSSLIEIGHGISTLAWVAVFLLLGYNLAVYSIRVLRRLISFSFSLYSAIFGGG